MNTRAASRSGLPSAPDVSIQVMFDGAYGSCSIDLGDHESVAHPTLSLFDSCSIFALRYYLHHPDRTYQLSNRRNADPSDKLFPNQPL